MRKGQMADMSTLGETFNIGMLDADPHMGRGASQIRTRRVGK